jgi:S1-C subfamily serine protease
VTINMARRLLLERRSFWSGMSGVAITGRVARAQPVGVMVQQVAADSPAARIGLRPGTIQATMEGKPFLLGGDIILAVQGQRIGAETYEALQERMSRLPAGSAISVIVLREGREVTLTAVKD